MHIVGDGHAFTRVEAGELVAGVEAYGLMRGIGNICVGADTDPDYDARLVVRLIIAGLRAQ